MQRSFAVAAFTHIFETLLHFIERVVNRSINLNALNAVAARCAPSEIPKNFSMISWGIRDPPLARCAPTAPGAQRASKYRGRYCALPLRRVRFSGRGYFRTGGP
jgi:hypothetical protein